MKRLQTIISIMASSSSSDSSLKQLTTNWLELPPEVMFLIFTKVGAIDILLGAQSVCSTWRKLCKDPQLFRSINIYDDNSEYNSTTNGRRKIMKLAKEAVNRSCGQLVDFSIETFATDDLLELIIAKNSPLRRLQFASCVYISDNVAIDMAKKLPLLEELEISYCDYFECSEEVVESFGRSCPLLKSFTLNYHHYDTFNILDDKEALAIAQSMPELLHLNLSGNTLTENGLQAILDGCPHLNFLDLSRCSNITFAWGLVKMCVDRNIELRLLDVNSIIKLLTRMIRQLLSLLKGCVRLIQEAKLEAGYNRVEESGAFCHAMEDLEAGFDVVGDLEADYTAKLYATCGSLKVLSKVLLNELSQMQSILSILFQENVLLVLEVVELEKYLQVLEAQLQNLLSQTSRMFATICSHTLVGQQAEAELQNLISQTSRMFATICSHTLLGQQAEAEF